MSSFYDSVEGGAGNLQSKLVQASEPTVRVPAVQGNALIPEGHRLICRFEGTEVRTRYTTGLRYFMQMVRVQGREITSTRLVELENGEPVKVMEASHLLEGDVALEENESIDGEVTHRVVMASEYRDEILPDDARNRLYESLDGMKADLACFINKGFKKEAEITEREIAEVEKYLKALRFGDRNICFSGQEDRNRKSVSNAVTRMIKLIAKLHPALAKHMKDCINLGTSCSYQPATRVNWKL